MIEKKIMDMLTSPDIEMMNLGVVLLSKHDTNWFKVNLPYFIYREKGAGRTKINDVELVDIPSGINRQILLEDITLYMAYGHIICTNRNKATESMTSEMYEIKKDKTGKYGKARVRRLRKTTGILGI